MKKVYICTPLKKEKINLDQIQKMISTEEVFAFIPPTEQLKDKTLGALIDKKMIENCDELWAFGLFGRDCAWEIGYAQGLGKKVKLFIDEKNKKILEEDWMTLCAGTEVIKI
mgnify:CR=1 FL=1